MKNYYDKSNGRSRGGSRVHVREVRGGVDAFWETMWHGKVKAVQELILKRNLIDNTHWHFDHPKESIKLLLHFITQHILVKLVLVRW